MKTSNDINTLLSFSGRELCIVLGILISIFIFNLSAVAEIDCLSLVNGPLQEKQSPEEKYKEGYCYIKLEKFDKGLALLEGLENDLTLIPDYVVYYRAVGEKGLGKAKAAAEDFYRILADYPESGLRKRAFLGLAEVYYDTRNYERAEKTYRILYNEENESQSKAFILGKIAESLEGEKKYSEAISAYRGIWVEFPESEFGDAAIEKALQISQMEGIPFEPKESEYLKRAERLFKLARWGPALESFDRVSEKTYDVKIKMVISKYRLGLLDEASNILASLNTPESLYWMSKISIKQGRDAEATETLSQISSFYPQSQLAPKALYEAASLNESNLNFVKALELYDLLLRTYPKNEFSQQAAWNIGWIHYRHGRYHEADITFSSINSPEALYWRGRTIQKEGKEQEALAIYNSLARTTTPSYYSYLAQQKVGFIPKLDSFPNPSASGVSVQGSNPRKKKTEFLIKLDTLEDAILEIKEMEKAAKSKWELLDVSSLYSKARDFSNSIRLARDIDLPQAIRLYYPMGLKEIVSEASAKYNVDEFLVYSIIREESRFQRDAVSYSGAIGLMQLIPPTGNSTAQKVGISGYKTDMLYVPNVNIELGTAYFKSVLDQFNRNFIYAIASYNGGPNNVAKWIVKLGNVDPDEFVEEIPFPETKNYVKKVLRSYSVYKSNYYKEGN